MKKILILSMATLMISFLTGKSGIITVAYADSAMDQLQDADESSSQAADEADHGDYEGAHNDAGASFDGNSYNDPSVVDLSDKQGVVDPQDLKQYDPQDNGGPIE
ncbi:MAG: hypothetical protein PHE73_06550 [Sulfurovaceae bacterium]|nr:hypothetical protein [Sulfurovaceae bacterium]